MLSTDARYRVTESSPHIATRECGSPAVHRATGVPPVAAAVSVSCAPN
jgi:hypothetical protein